MSSVMPAIEAARPPAGAGTPRLAWRQVEVIERIAETPRATTLVLDVPGWPGHLAGQHVDIRLTADDGYQAQRSYSIASPPEVPQLALTVERLERGEVSPWLVDEARPGDRFELRGPIGGYFAWSVTAGGPLLLVAGGSGVAPLMAMLRHRAASGEAGYAVSACLLLSSRSVANVIYREELQRLGSAPDGPKVVHTLTRAQPPPGWRGYARRIDAPMLAEVGFQPAAAPKVFVCGPTPMVEAVAEALVGLGRSTATPRVVCCARSSRSTRRRRGRHARAAPGQRRWQSCASTPSSWAPSCAAPL
ncbi:MAG TPA: ferredoxin reductase, partial [Hyphomicrobiaceae bacterium]|nr:ferredoxin reductase [Hyphomicrobiaceae bacterium]